MAERSEASPTGDPLIAQAEQAEMEARQARAARLFDVRRLIGGLFVVYGVILVILGFGESDESIARSADINVNLWAGLGMLVLGLLFLAWAFLRPLGDDGVGEGGTEATGSEAASRRPRGDPDRPVGGSDPGR